MTYAHLPPEARRDLYRRLRASYSADRARDILEDRDPASQADLAAWRALGQPKREGAA